MTDLQQKRALIVLEVIAERDQQDERFGGADNDSYHAPVTWGRIIDKHNRRAVDERGMDRRYALIRVAATAVAAIEAFDRAQQAVTATHTTKGATNAG